MSLLPADDHRLFAALDVEDRETPVTESGGIADPNSGFVRAAESHRLRHSLDGRSPIYEGYPEVHKPRNATQAGLLGNGRCRPTAQSHT